jgi:hypothetical protein
MFEDPPIYNLSLFQGVFIIGEISQKIKFKTLNSKLKEEMILKVFSLGKQE